jgi:hypothetical protein
VAARTRPWPSEQRAPWEQRRKLRELEREQGMAHRVSFSPSADESRPSVGRKFRAWQMEPSRELRPGGHSAEGVTKEKLGAQRGKLESSGVEGMQALGKS